jgi:transposase
MAFRELTMIDIREVLRRWQALHSVRRVARETGTDRKTVARYVAAAQAAGVGVDTPLDDEVVARVTSRVQVRGAAAAGDAAEVLKPHAAQLRAWLESDKPLRLTKVHVLLGRMGVEVSYPTLRRYVMKELEWRRPAVTVRVDDPPAGQEAQLDFGRMGRVTFMDGTCRVLWALVLVLSRSRHMFVWPTFVQTTEAVVSGLEAAWRFFGGMPRTLVPDNMKAIVDRAGATEFALVMAFGDYVQARGLFVDPARVRRPQDKPRVENQVAYVRESWFSGETFADLDAARESAQRWCENVAGTRIHGTTRRVPLEVFQAEERACLLPLPTAPYDVPHFANARVHPDHHVQVKQALYSVPTRYVGQDVTVRADRSLVKIYLRGELIKTHRRVGAGERSTDENDYPAGRSGYATRSLDDVLSRARAQGQHVGLYVERLLSGPLPWTRMRQAYVLLRLVEKFGAERVEAVCRSALAFDVVDVGRVGRMLKKAHATEQVGAEQGRVVALAPTRFSRPVEHFATRRRSEGGER